MQDGTLLAQQVHLYPDALRGSGEGQLPQANGRIAINGAVTAISDGRMTLFYRGGRMAEWRSASTGPTRGYPARSVPPIR